VISFNQLLLFNWRALHLIPTVGRASRNINDQRFSDARVRMKAAIKNPATEVERRPFFRHWVFVRCVCATLKGDDEKVKILDDHWEKRRAGLRRFFC